MRVTYVVNTLDAGGTERSLADLLPGLRDAGVDVDVVALRPGADGGVEPALRADGVAVTVVGTAGPLGTILALRRIIRERRPDVVHTMLFDSNLYGRLATAGTGVRTVVSLVNTTYGAERLADPRLTRWKVRAVQLVDIALAHSRTDRFHAVSEAVERDAVAGLRLRPERVVVIERGRRPEAFPPVSADRRTRARATLGLADHAEVLVNVGSQEYQKGHRYLLAAMERLLDRPDLVLLVAGRTGNETSELRRLLDDRPDVAARVRLLGYRPDVADVLATGDLFVFPSLFEGMPGAVIEAMAADLPIVASDIEPVRGVVEPSSNAMLVPLRDPDSIAVAVRSLLDDPERRRAMGVRSRELFEERFTMERSVAAFVRLYDELVNRSPDAIRTARRRRG